jgi:NADH:ubiquinone oxidoreductase subunit 5 (subunit L)/multisubunit Na+/H+ antiporter MnhA subunit
MVSANNMLLIYLGLELMSCRSYALVALRRDQRGVHRSRDEVLRARRAWPAASCCTACR